jgi:hypothetical protein
MLLCLALLAHTVAAAAADIPLLAIRNHTAPWAAPNPKLPFPVGPNPGLTFEGIPAVAATATGGSDTARRRLQPPAPKSKQGLLLGDIRAHLRVTAAVAAAGGTATAQIFWRR